MPNYLHFANVSYSVWRTRGGVLILMRNNSRVFYFSFVLVHGHVHITVRVCVGVCEHFKVIKYDMHGCSPISVHSHFYRSKFAFKQFRYAGQTIYLSCFTPFEHKIHPLKTRVRTIVLRVTWLRIANRLTFIQHTNIPSLYWSLFVYIYIYMWITEGRWTKGIIRARITPKKGVFYTLCICRLNHIVG